MKPGDILDDDNHPIVCPGLSDMDKQGPLTYDELKEEVEKLLNAPMEPNLRMVVHPEVWNAHMEHTVLCEACVICLAVGPLK